MRFEDVLSQPCGKNDIQKIVVYVGSNAERFARLVGLLSSLDLKVAARAAWGMSICLEDYPALLRPHFKTILDLCLKPDASGALKRNFTRALRTADIPDNCSGGVATLCFSCLSDANEGVAQRCFSMMILEKMSRTYAELRPELETLITHILEREAVTPGLKNTALKTLQLLGKGKK